MTSIISEKSSSNYKPCLTLPLPALSSHEYKFHFREWKNSLPCFAEPNHAQPSLASPNYALEEYDFLALPTSPHLAPLCHSKPCPA